MPDFAPEVCLCTPVRDLKVLTEKSGATGDEKMAGWKGKWRTTFLACISANANYTPLTIGYLSRIIYLFGKNN
jgi:hypothetical protein